MVVVVVAVAVVGVGVSWVVRGRLPALLLVVTDAACARLVLADLAEVEPHGAGAEGVVLRPAAVLLVGGAEAADERVEAAPGLP